MTASVLRTSTRLRLAYWPVDAQTTEPLSVQKKTVLQFIVICKLSNFNTCIAIITMHYASKVIIIIVSSENYTPKLVMLQLFHILTFSLSLKKSSVRKSLVVKPIISKHMNLCCQVDLIDMQSAGWAAQIHFELLRSFD